MSYSDLFIFLSCFLLWHLAIYHKGGEDHRDKRWTRVVLLLFPTPSPEKKKVFKDTWSLHHISLLWIHVMGIFEGAGIIPATLERKKHQGSYQSCFQEDISIFFKCWLKRHMNKEYVEKLKKCIYLLTAKICCLVKCNR